MKPAEVTACAATTKRAPCLRPHGTVDGRPNPPQIDNRRREPDAVATSGFCPIPHPDRSLAPTVGTGSSVAVGPRHHLCHI